MYSFSIRDLKKIAKDENDSLLVWRKSENSSVEFGTAMDALNALKKTPFVCYTSLDFAKDNNRQFN